MRDNVNATTLKRKEKEKNVYIIYRDYHKEADNSNLHKPCCDALVRLGDARSTLIVFLD